MFENYALKEETLTQKLIVENKLCKLSEMIALTVTKDQFKETED